MTVLPPLPTPGYRRDASERLVFADASGRRWRVWLAHRKGRQLRKVRPFEHWPRPDARVFRCEATGGTG